MTCNGCCVKMVRHAKSRKENFSWNFFTFKFKLKTHFSSSTTVLISVWGCQEVNFYREWNYSLLSAEVFNEKTLTSFRLCTSQLQINLFMVDVSLLNSKKKFARELILIFISNHRLARVYAGKFWKWSYVLLWGWFMQ